MAEHPHHRDHASGNRELSLALFLTLSVMAAEIVAAYLSGSLSLLADAGHMLADACALTLSVFAAWVTKRPASPAKTYGYYRMEILAALANGVLLWVLVVWICLRAFERLQHPVAVQPSPMLTVAVIGLAVNLLCGWLLYKGSKDNMNVRSAWLNVMADALGSLGVIVAAFVIARTGWLAADAVASFVIAFLIAAGSWGMVRQSLNVLLEGAPSHLRTQDVERAMREVSGVREVHDLHLWTITTGMEAMSGHVIVEDLARSSETLA